MKRHVEHVSKAEFRTTDLNLFSFICDLCRSPSDEGKVLN
jgi:hypothetical protein